MQWNGAGRTLPFGSAELEYSSQPERDSPVEALRER